MTRPSDTEIAGVRDEDLQSQPGRRFEAFEENLAATDERDETDEVDRDKRSLDLTTDVEEAYAALDPRQRTIANLGFEKTAGVRRPKGTNQIIVVSSLREHRTELERFIEQEELATPLGIGTVQVANSPIVRTQYLVAGKDQIFRLVKEAPKGIEVSTKQSQDQTRAFRLNGLVTAIDPHLFRAGELSDHIGIDPTLKITLNDGNIHTLKGSQLPHKDIVEYQALHAFRESVQSAKESPTTLPENLYGDCRYLIIDHNLLSANTEGHQALAQIFNQLTALAKSEELLITNDYAGNLVIIGLSQRAGGFLAKASKGLSRLSKDKANLLLGDGNLVREGDNALSIDGYPNPERMRKLKGEGSKAPQRYIANSTVEKLRDSRDGTTAQITTEPTSWDPGISSLKEVSSEVNFRAGGGPDHLIGLKEEFETAKRNFSMTGEVKLTQVKGKAGSGKSTLAAELEAHYPNMIKLSVDAGGEGLPGHGLICIAEQLVTGIKNQLDEKTLEKYSAQFKPLFKFDESDPNQKSGLAVFRPQEVTKACLLALQTLEKINGSFPVILDDVHHIDRHSDQHVMDLIFNLITTTDCKLGMFMRPEERYRSAAQKSLERRLQLHYAEIGQKAQVIDTVWTQDPKSGKPKLDLKNSAIAEEFVLSSSPKDLRINSRTGRPRKLATLKGQAGKTWADVLGAKSETGLTMRNLIRRVLKNPRNLTTNDDEISLTPKGAAEIDKISKEGDDNIYERQRIKKLKPAEKTLVECMAILGSRISHNRLIEITAAVLGQSPDDLAFLKDIKMIIAGGYIIPASNEISENSPLKLQDDTLRDHLLETMNPAKKGELSLKIYNYVKDDPSIADDNKFHLVLNAARNTPYSERSKPLWAHCISRGRKVLEESARMKAHGRGYSTSNAVLSDLDPNAKNTLNEALGKLVKNPNDKSIHPEIKEFIIENLLMIVKSGISLGRFGKVHEAIEYLEKLDAQAQLTEAYLAGFQASYAQGDTAKLDNYHNKLVTRNLPEGERLCLEIRYQFKSAGDSAKKIGESLEFLTRNKSTIDAISAIDPRLGPEFKRLENRIHFELIRKNLENNGFDGDVIMNPSLLTAQDRLSKKPRGYTQKKLTEALTELSGLEARIKVDPTTLEPIQELYLLDLLGQLRAMQGDYKRASETLGEAWRVATQMETHREAARAAKLQGDTLVMQGIAKIFPATENDPTEAKPFPHGTILRQYIQKAVDVYNEAGVNSINLVDEKDEYHLILRAQSIRAIGILIDSYEKELVAALRTGDAGELARIKKELTPYIAVAASNLDYLRKSERWNAKLESKNGVCAYYVSPYLAKIINCVNRLGIPTQLPDTTTLFQAEKVEDALRFFRSVQAKDHVGETLRKLSGLKTAIELVQKQAKSENESTEIARLGTLKTEIETLMRAA